MLQLGVELAVQLASPLTRLPVLDELGDRPVRSLAYLVVNPRPRWPLAYLFESLRPRLDVQVVGVYERSIYVQKYGPLKRPPLVTAACFE